MQRFVKIYYLLPLLLGMLFPITLSAQKEVRKNVRKGNKEYLQQKYADASELYGKALGENPASKEATFNQGNTLYRQKDWAASVEQYQHFLTLEQENPAVASEAWHNVGNTMLQQKDLQKSMEAYKMALRLNPEDDEARYNLAVVQKMLQDQEQEQQDQEQQEDQEQEQQQDPQGDSPQNPRDQEKRPEQQEGPEQMLRDNARQLLQAIEQDERDTQEKVQRMKAQEREERAQENRRRNKNW